MNEVKGKNNPHDLYFKSTFGRLDFARDFMKNYLPEELIEIINLNSLAHEPTTYLDKELKEQFADLVYKTEIKGRQAYISFLFEHKSYKDRMVVFQVLKYMVSIWENKIKNDLENAKIEKKELKTEEIEIPIIIPVVVYHDRFSWNIKRSLGEMMPGFLALSANIKKYISDFEYLLADISHPEKDKQASLEEEYAIVLETLSKIRYESKEQIIGIFKRAIEIYTKTKDIDMVSHYISETIVYIISTRDDFDGSELQEIAGQISKEGGELFMTLAERLIEEGMEKGLEEGLEKGLEKGIEKGMEKGRRQGLKKGREKERQELAKNLLLDGMEIAMVAKYTKLSREEVQKIKDKLQMQ